MTKEVNMISYPGQPDIDPDTLTNFEMGSGQDPDNGSNAYWILFKHESGSPQIWNWSEIWKRDQAYAFLWDQHTNYESGMNLDALEQSHGSPIVEAEIFRTYIVLTQENGGEVKTPEIPIQFVGYHLLILDMINSGRVKLNWTDPDLKPYPLSVVK